MGRKKGKQRGHYSSKAKKAQHVHELNQHVNDVHHEWRNNSSRSRGSNQSTSSSQLAKFQKERGAVSVSILRGMIRERLFEERERDAVYRRQLMTATIVANRNHNNTTTFTTNSITTRTHNANSYSRLGLATCSTNYVHPIGWSLAYNHREALAGIEQPKEDICTFFMNQQEHEHSSHTYNIEKEESGNQQSLQISCVKTLAPFLQQYIDSCGEEYIIKRLSLLPPHVITALSVCCEDVTDQIIYVMTSQLHVEALVFYGSSGGSSDNKSDDNETFEKQGERSNEYVTGTGFYLNEQDTSSLSISTAIESWEDYHILHEEDEKEKSFLHFSNNNSINNHWRKNLRRLELRNIQCKDTHTTNHFISFLKQNPQLTSLCISESFNAISGPKILFCQDKDVEFIEEGDHDDEVDDCHYDGITILNYLEKLQYLDVSGCTWINFDLLYRFLRRILSQRQSSHFALEMIVVERCCSYLTHDKIAMLNSLTDKKNMPLLCSKAP